VNTFAYVGGGLALAPLTVWQAAGFPFERVTMAGWVSLLYMAVFPSVVCYLIYYHALTHMMPSRVSSVSYIQPVLATLMAVILLGEHVTPSLVLSAAVILFGVYLVERG
jgi:drug/metabolite transporter (DMT)-like permease